MRTSETVLMWSTVEDEGYDLSEHLEEEISARGSYEFIPEGKPVSLTQASYEKSLREAFATVSPQMKIDPHNYVDPRAEYNHPAADPVEHPAHYNNGGIECIDYLKDNMSWEGYTGYLEGNCKKYLHRWRYKAKPLEDLKKARWYLDRLISELEGPDEP